MYSGPEVPHEIDDEDADFHLMIVKTNVLCRLYGGLMSAAEEIAKIIKHMNCIFFESVKFTNHSTKISRK